jgi:hypothetical protein
MADSSCPQPTITGLAPGCPANWTAATDFVEVLPILSACPGQTTGTCTYYIGVSGYSSGQHAFTIVVGDQAGPVPLANGIPANGEVAVNAATFFAFQPYVVTLMSSPLTVSVNAMSGDPDVYVLLSSTGAPTATPGPASYTYSLAGLQGSNLLIMEPTWLLEEMQSRPMPSPMLVAAAVELNQNTYNQYRRIGGRPRKVKP